jgi:uncharacterized protein (UPF0276 family)
MRRRVWRRLRGVRLVKAIKQHLGLGIGWRPELAHLIDRRGDLGFVEVIAENLDPRAPLPRPLEQLRDRGLRIIPHGVSLSLGGSEPVNVRRVERLARLAEKLDAPLVSEHIAFVRAGGTEIGHLTPLPRTNEALEVLVENVEAAKAVLPVPLALENIAALFEWPEAELEEAQFVTAALERTDTLLLLDISNAYANGRNCGIVALKQLSSFPLERLAYVHLGGGVEKDGVVHDTHSDPVLPGAIELLTALCVLTQPPGAMLERDENFPGPAEINAELDRIREALRTAAPRAADYAV